MSIRWYLEDKSWSYEMDLAYPLRPYRLYDPNGKLHKEFGSLDDLNHYVKIIKEITPIIEKRIKNKVEI